MEKNRKMALLLAFTLMIGTLPSCKGSEESIHESGKVEDDAIEEVVQERENGISTSSYDALMTRLSMVNVLYENEEAFFPKEKIQDYMRLAETTKTTCDNEDEDYSQLAKTIIDNSIWGVRENFCPFSRTPDALEEGSEEWKVDRRFRNSLSKAIDIVFKNGDHVEEDICRMKNLRMAYAAKVEGNSITFCYIPETDMFIFDEEAFENNYKRNSLLCIANGEKTWTKDEYLTKELAFYLNVYRMGCCNCRLENGQEYSSVSFSDYVFLSFVVGNAQAQIMRSKAFKNTSLTQYDNIGAIQNEALLLMLSCFKENKNIDEYSNALYDSDLQRLFDFFEITEDNLEWFYRIVTALDASSGFGKFAEDERETMSFREWLEETSSITGPAKIDILKSATEDLINSICNSEDLTKEEADMLFKFLKANLVSQNSNTIYLNFKSNEATVFGSVEEFRVAVREIEDTYYDFLATYYGLSNEELKTLRARALVYPNLNDPSTMENLDGIDFKKLQARYPLMMEIWNILSGKQDDLERFLPKKGVPSKTMHFDKMDN